MSPKARERKRLGAIYDRMYKKADKLLKEHNPCRITPIKEKPGCFSCAGSWSGGSTLCCAGCLWFDKGCTIKALGCKLWLCSRTAHKNPELVAILKGMIERANSLGIFHIRTGRKGSLDLAMAGVKCNAEWALMRSNF